MKDLKAGPDHGKGLLIINADDWGLDRETTDRIWRCAIEGRVSAVSAMVFMEDSERAAELSRQCGITTGLHLNFTSAYCSKNCPPALAEKQRKITAWLRSNRFSKAIFHPGLRGSFEYVVKAQLEEFERLYGVPPARLDGHHHMHLCPNVLFGALMPDGTTVRRNFSFQPGEKGALNRLYRSAVDRILERRHILADFFFALAPITPMARLHRIFALAKNFTVEVETHPVVADEYEFLTGDEMRRMLEDGDICLLTGTRRGSVSLT